MAVNRGPHVRDIFIGYQGFDYEEKESKKSFNVTKKGMGGPTKLGAFKPKILAGDPSGNISLPTTKLIKEDTTQRPSDDGNINKAFIIGDKDVPMMLEPSENIYSEIGDTPGEARHAATGDAEDQTTSNPLFNDSPRHQGSVYRDNGPRSPRSPVPQTIPEEIEGVTVPPPDYDEDEMTLEFEGDDPGARDKSVYREFAGEDFAQYLSDDEEDYEFDRPVYTMRSKPPVSRKAITQKSKTEAWRPKKDNSKSLFSKNTNKKSSGKNTLRHFSVTDTKLGITVDGTTKQPKASIRSGIPMDQSYEAFLQSRNGGPRWGSVESASSDSGHETGEDVRKRDKQNTFWKKLTVKMSRKSKSFDMV